jgi:outer membrane lipoprotein-sorting protein
MDDSGGVKGLIMWTQKRHQLCQIGALFVLGFWAVVGSSILVDSAQGGPPAIALTPEEQGLLADVEIYLASIDTLQARLIQLSETQGYAHGQVYLDRPGLLRINYVEPFADELVSDGVWLYYWDAEVGTDAKRTLSGTPIALIVESAPSLTEKTTVRRILNAEDRLEIDITVDGEEDQGRMVLVFGKAPFVLAGWRVIDAQGFRTEIELRDPLINVPLDTALFEFTRSDD